MKKIRILFLPVGGPPEVREIDDTLEAKQALVGGLIEIVCVDENAGGECSGVDLWVNEEGKCMNLAPNRPLLDAAGRRYDVVVGDAFLTRSADTGTEDGLVNVDMTDEDVADWTKRFAEYLLPGSEQPEPDGGFVERR